MDDPQLVVLGLDGGCAGQGHEEAMRRGVLEPSCSRLWTIPVRQSPLSGGMFAPQGANWGVVSLLLGPRPTCSLKPVRPPHTLLQHPPCGEGAEGEARRGGVHSRAPPSTPRSSLLRKHVGSAHGHRHQRHAQAFSANDCRKRVGSGHRHRHIRHAQAFSAKGWRPRFPIWTGATDILSPPATPGVKNRVVSAEQLL